MPLFDITKEFIMQEIISMLSDFGYNAVVTGLLFYYMLVESRSTRAALENNTKALTRIEAKMGLESEAGDSDE